MDIEKALARLADAPFDHVDFARIETGVMTRLAQNRSVISSQASIRFGAVAAAMIVGVGLGGGAVANNQDRSAMVSGAHLAPSTLLVSPQ